MNIEKDFDDIVNFAKKIRHELHKHPELSWSEYKTSKKIRNILNTYGIEWKEYSNTGTVGYIAKNKKGIHIALRCDIDAIEISEKTNLPYSSLNESCMHACGHDGHTATLIAVALFLKKNENSLPGPISLIFQPAEEGGHGAKQLIIDGCLNNVDYIYGWHNWPSIKYNQALCPDGTIMAGNATFKVYIQGRGGHSSQPEVCKDPVLAASAITMALQQIVSRQVSPQKASVVSVTSINAPSGLTTIPSKSYLHGSIRFSDHDMKEDIKRSMFSIINNISTAYGVSSNIEFNDRYNPTINHSIPSITARKILNEIFGENWKSDHISPIMASEDFSYYLNKIPGAFILIGSDDGTNKYNISCHNDQYCFNDNLIEKASKVLIRLANYSGPIL